MYTILLTASLDRALVSIVQCIFQVLNWTELKVLEIEVQLYSNITDSEKNTKIFILVLSDNMQPCSATCICSSYMTCMYVFTCMYGVPLWLKLQVSNTQFLYIIISLP